jgi:hypothetical protein
MHGIRATRCRCTYHLLVGCIIFVVLQVSFVTISRKDLLYVLQVLLFSPAKTWNDIGDTTSPLMLKRFTGRHLSEHQIS